MSASSVSSLRRMMNPARLSPSSLKYDIPLDHKSRVLHIHITPLPSPTNDVSARMVQFHLLEKRVDKFASNHLDAFVKPSSLFVNMNQTRG